MRNSRLIVSIGILSILCFTGCKRGQPAPPEVQKTTGVQQTQQPVTVTGCLRSGTFAESTWVLITPSTPGGAAAATYELTGGDPAVLRTNVGRQVEVAGIVDAQERVATSSGPMRVPRAEGTSGTPTVETTRQVDIKRLAVDSVKVTGTRCD